MQQRLAQDLIAAMKARNQPRMDAIRQVKAAVTNQEVQQGSTMTDAQVEEVIGRLVRQHRESIDMFSKGNRAELVAKEKAQLDILLAYLPQQMTAQEVLALAQQAAAEVGARGPADKGKVMSRLMPQVKGKAEGKAVNNAVTEVLSKL